MIEEPQKTIYSAEQQAVIDGLMEAQKHLGISDKEFAAKWLKTYTETTWSRMRAGTYGAKDTTKAFAELGTALVSIRRRIERLMRQTQGGKFYEFDQFAALFKAIGECLIKKGQNRLCFFVAPTGAGKSRFITELEAREDTVALMANESWAGSYYFATLDILRALEVEGKFNTAADARRAMLERMKGRVNVLAIDEGNYFGNHSINLVKDILNETEWTVLIALTPPSFERMRRYYDAWSQLNRRVHTVFRHQALTAKQVCEVLQDVGMNGESKQAAIPLVAAANAFGSFDFVQRVIEQLEESAPPHPSVEDVVTAIVTVKANLDIK